jgi:hypothetical protein
MRRARLSTASVRLLVLAGGGSLAVAGLHIVLAFSVGLCRFCGAPDWVLTASLPTRLAVTLAIAAVFGTLGAVVLRPLARDVAPRALLLIAVGAVYTLRGLLVVPEVLNLCGFFGLARRVAPQMPVFSLVSLLIGLAHLGAVQALRAPAPGVSPE